MAFADWSIWGWDWYTGVWVAWIVFFFMWETVTLLAGQPLTAHLRPVFLSAPIVWWLAVGAWLWMGVHLLAPALEAWLIDIVQVQ